MRMRRLGNTELLVSELGFGSLFTSRLGPGFEISRQAVFAAIDAGVNFFDTAPAYANSEEVLGQIIREVKAPIIVSTKLGGRPQPFDPHSRQHLRESVETSLKLLHREVIDVLFIHEPDRPQQHDWWTDAERVIGPVVDEMAALERDGLVRFIGLAGTTVTELAHLVRAAQFDVVLTAFNCSPLFREAEAELIPNARAKGMGVVLGSVLHQGALGRRFDDVVRRKPIWLSTARQKQLLDFYRLLDEAGLDIVECALRWALHRRAGDTVLIGPKTPRQVEAAIRATALGPLPADVETRLDELAAELPNRPFEEPMIPPFVAPERYSGPGMANLGVAARVGRL